MESKQIDSKRSIDEAPEASVLVCTYNRAEMLRDALQSLLRQETESGPTFEIVVIDNASTDHTRAVVEHAFQRCPGVVRYVLEAEPGVAHARNRSLREARGEWLAFFDDDELAEPDWLARLYFFAKRSGARCIGGTVRLDLSEAERREVGPVGRAALRETETSWGNEPRKCRERERPGTCNLLVHRSLFSAVGEFDASMVMGGEDHDFLIRVRRAGFDIWYLPTAVVHHRIPLSRLTPAYYSWDAMQTGYILAHFDFKYRGPVKPVFLCLARIGQALLLNLPRWLFALMRGDESEAMVRKSLLRRAEAYTRTTIARIAPWIVSEKKLFRSLEFRRGREVAAASQGGPDSGHSDERGLAASLSQRCGADERDRTPQASVLVCTYNRADMLRDALHSLVGQQTDAGPTYEIVVVDNASTDDTKTVVMQVMQEHPDLVRYVYEAEPGIAAARNRAVREARGEWLAWVDDDEFAEPDWLARLYFFAKEAGARCIGGLMRLDLSEEERKKLGILGNTALRETETSWGIEARKCRQHELPGTCNLLVHRSLFMAVGMFDPSIVIGGSDHDLLIRVRRAGFDIWYLPTAVVYHRIPPSRLTPAYFNWSALQSGAILARSDIRYRGPLIAVLLCMARIGQALLVNLPRRLFARMRGDKAQAMVRQALLRRAEGYTRATVARIAPWIISEEKLLHSLEFRRGRAIGLAQPSTTRDRPSSVQKTGTTCGVAGESRQPAPTVPVD